MRACEDSPQNADEGNNSAEGLSLQPLSHNVQNRGRGDRGKGDRRKLLEGKLLEGKLLEGKAARGKTARGDTARGKTARGETARGKAVQNWGKISLNWFIGESCNYFNMYWL